MAVMPKASGPVFSSDVELLLACAERDLGLAFVAEPETRREVASRKLETVLDEYSVQMEGLFLYFPSAARDVPRLRAFITCARELGERER